MGYKITSKDMEEISQDYKSIPQNEWLRLIFCELHEIKEIMDKKVE